METVRTAPSDDSVALRREIDRLKADLQRLRTEFTGLADDAVHAAIAGTAEAKERVGQTARAFATKGRESADAVGDQVAAHPLMSIATAFAVGMVVGLGLSRKD